MSNSKLSRPDIVVLFILFIIFINVHSIFRDKSNRTEIVNNNYQSIIEIKPKQTELTYEKLKTYKGFEGITEEESAKHIESIKKMAKVLFYLHQNEQNN